MASVQIFTGESNDFNDTHNYIQEITDLPRRNSNPMNQNDYTPPTKKAKNMDEEKSEEDSPTSIKQTMSSDDKDKKFLNDCGYMLSLIHI